MGVQNQRHKRHKRLIPLSVLALDPDVFGERTPSEWVRLLPDEIFEDDFGRLCVTATTALALADEHREQKAKRAEAAARRAAQRRPQPVPAGVPAQEGLEAFETMMAEPTYATPRDEFGRPSPDFLTDELEAGRRAAAEAEARAKSRAAARMKDELS
jgi:hypothetical protein